MSMAKISRIVGLFGVLGLYCLFAMPCMLQSNVCMQVDFSSGSPVFDELLLQNICTPSYHLGSFSCSADIALDQQELAYLFSVSVGEPIIAQDIIVFLQRLAHKKKWKVALLRMQHDNTKLHIQCQLTTVWTIQDIAIKGIWHSIQDYRACYQAGPGDIFDEDCHKTSIKKIKHLLHDKGYCNALVRDEIIPNNTTKSVQIVITIEQRALFNIGDISIAINKDNASDKDLPGLYSCIQGHLVKCLNGKLYTRLLVDTCGQVIKRILIHEGYAHHKITLHQHIHRSTNTIDLSVQIRLYNKRALCFQGNHYFSDEQLLDHLIDYSHSFWMLPSCLLAEELSRWYSNQGFLNIHIEAKDERWRSVFTVKEGSCATIAHVNIQGVVAMPLRSVKKIFKGLLHKRAEAHVIQKAVQKVKFLYEQAGFADMRIEQYSVNCAPGADTHFLDLFISEGERYWINAIQVPEFLMFESLMQPKNKMPFCASYINKQRIRLERLLNTAGYSMFRITPEICKNSDCMVTVIWHVDMSNVSTVFGKTVICGSSRIPFNAVHRALGYKEQEQWKQEKITATMRRLCDLNVFQHVSLHAAHEPGNEQEKTMILTLQDDTPFEVRVRAGIELENVQRFRTLAGLAYKVGGSFLAINPLQAMDLCRLDVDITPSHRELIARYVYPYPWSLPIDLISQGYGIKHEQPGFMGSSENIYTVYQNGMLLGTRYHSDRFDMEGTLGFEWMKTSVTDQVFADRVSQAMDFFPPLLGVYVPYLFFEQTCMADYLDERADPTTGSFTLCTLKTMIPLSAMGKDSFFIRFLCDHSHFIPLHLVILGFRIRFGHIFYKAFNTIMPTERYYLGGAQSLRGYDTDSVPPLGHFVDDHGNEQWVPRGGKTMLNINAEIRIPFTETLGGVLFQDFGVLSGNHFSDLTMNDVHAATGFGLRYKTPLGPLRFDVGFKWSKSIPEERSYAWYLTFGQAF